MGSKRRRFLELVATTSAVSVAGCSGDGDSNEGDDESNNESTNTGASDDGDSNGGDEGSNEDNDADGDSDGGDDGSSDGDSEGDTDDGDAETDEQLQPADFTGTAQSSIEELEVVSHDVTGVDPQVQIDLELRNAGDENNIALTHHNIQAKLFDADGNDVLREQSGTRGPESSPPPGETRVVTIYSFPEAGSEPASYEITVNCDGVDYDSFTYCESE
jgi:hypothetical protein